MCRWTVDLSQVNWRLWKFVVEIYFEVFCLVFCLFVESCNVFVAPKHSETKAIIKLQCISVPLKSDD